MKHSRDSPLDPATAVTPLQNLQQGDAIANVGIPATCGAKAKSLQGDAPQMTPEHSSLVDVLHSSCSTDVTATIECRAEMGAEQYGHGRRPLQGQVNVVPYTVDQHHCEGQPITVPHRTKSNPSKRVSLLTSVDPKNIIDMTTDEGDEYAAGDKPPTSSLPVPFYTLRNRKATQGKLIYDGKYHPMDDSIRPSRAAKRRSLHGEAKASLDESWGASLAHEESTEDESDFEERKEPTKKGTKRGRCSSQAPQPTRRSSRKSLNPKMSYNMSIHPQDRDLEMSSSDDSYCDIGIPRSKRRVSARSVGEEFASVSDDHRKADSVLEIPSGIIATKSDSPENDGGSRDQAEDTNFTGEKTALLKMPSPLSTVMAAAPYGIRRREGLDVWKIDAGKRYFRYDRESWPDTQGLPFEIYNESLEAQLAAEANAASPFNFDSDDKENDVGHNRYEETSDPTQGISAVPHSEYRRTGEERVVSEAFYNLERSVSLPYGLGGVDGTSDHGTREGPMSEAMSILTSGAGLRREEGKEHTNEADTALTLHASTSSDVDSVLGRSSSALGNFHP